MTRKNANVRGSDAGRYLIAALERIDPAADFVSGLTDDDLRNIIRAARGKPPRKTPL